MLRKIFIFSIFLISSLSVNAAVVASLQFIDSDGPVLATDSIEIWVRLSLSSSSDPLFFDPSLANPYGLDSTLIPSTGQPLSSFQRDVPFASFISAGAASTVRFGAGNFSSTNVSVFGGRNTWIGIGESPFIMNAGESRDFLIGEIRGKAADGALEIGDYTVKTAALGFSFLGLSDETELIRGFSFFATACPGGEINCSFTQTVVSAVPIPATAWLFGSALIGLVGLKRKKSSS